jgi:hypothetical protein
VTADTGGTIEIPERSYTRNATATTSTSISRPALSLVAEDNTPLWEKVSSTMTFNPETQKYEMPAPTWFNKETGEYEDTEPIVFSDSNIAMSKQQMQKGSGVREPKVLPASSDANKNNILTKIERFDEDLAQKSFRETTGKMLSKRVAAKLTKPSIQSTSKSTGDTEEKYGPLKRFVPKDVEIASLPPNVNTDDVIKAWRNTPAILARPKKKKKPPRFEQERVRSLITHKSGRRGSMLAATKESHESPKIIKSSSTRGDWSDDTSEKVQRSWKVEKLQSTAWWENSGTSSWKPRNERTKLEQPEGRLTINPVTGKLEDTGRFVQRDVVGLQTIMPDNKAEGKLQPTHVYS